MIPPAFCDTFPVPSPSEHLQYRKRKEWQNLAGQRGEVYSVTTVLDPPAGFELLAPYDQMLVKLSDGTMRTFMGAYGEKFQIDDQVELFVGLFPTGDEQGIIKYRVKARHPVVPSEKVRTTEK